MDENIPPTNKAILVFFEGIALALAFGGEENLRAGNPLWISILEWIFSLALSYLGFKWASLAKHFESWRVGSSTNLLLIVALMLTWGFFGYNYYDHHRNENRGQLRISQFAWGPTGTPDGFTRASVTLHILTPDRLRTDRLAAVCYHDTGLIDHSDIELSKSGLYDIAEGSQSMLIKYSDTFLAELQRGQRGTVYTILLVPRGITMERFTTLRQAEALGVRLVFAGGGPP